MKLNLEIQLDWIDEEMNLDDTVRQNVIDAVVNKIQDKIEKQVTTEINKTLNEAAVAKINQMTEDLFNDFIGREVTLSDKYGDKIKIYKSMQDLIKERFDNFMTQKVNEKGDATDSTYGTTFTRLTFIIDKQLKEFANKFTTDAVKQVSAEIQLHVKEGLTQKLGAELMKVLKVDKMLQLNNGNS